MAKVHLPLDVLPQGVLVAGNTGSGKSNLLFCLLLQVMSACRVWVAEMYKTQMRHLRPLFRENNQELIVLRPAQWKFNILQAGGNDPRTHLAMVTDLMVRTWNLPGRSRSILSQGGYLLYKKFGVWERTKVEQWPCLCDLYDWVYHTEGLNAAARDAILDRLGSFITAARPECIAWRRGWEAPDLARYSIVFEMSGASEIVKQLYLESLLFSLMQHQVQTGGFNKPLSLLACFEDAQRFFHVNRSAAGGDVTPMDELAGVIRGCGIGLLLNVQTMQGMSDVVPNLATKIMGRMGCHDDYRRLGADMAMNSAQIDYARRHLRPGKVIVQCATGKWREPVLVDVPFVDVPAVVNDDEVDKSVHALDSLPTVPASEYSDWQPHYVIHAGNSLSSLDGQLSEIAMRFLTAVIDHPGKPSSRYAKLARVSGRRAAELRRQLIDAGYLREHEVATSGRGRTAIVLEPLEPAALAVGRNGVGP